MESDISGKRLKVITQVDYIPWQKRSYDTDGAPVYSGVVFEILEQCAKALNFTYDVVIQEDDIWGIPYENGSFNGMIGVLERKEADLGAGAFTINYERQRVVDFTPAFWEDKNAFLTNYPMLQNRSLLMFSPFTPKVWLVFGITALMFGLSLYIINKCSTNCNAVSKSTGNQSLQDCILLSIKAHLRQSDTRVPQSKPAKIMTAVLWLILIFAYTLYAGILTSALSVVERTPSVKNTQDLLDSKRDFGVVKGIALESLLMNSPSGHLKELWDSSYRERIPFNFSQMIPQVSSGDLVIIHEKTGLMNYVWEHQKSGQCSLSLVDSEEFPKFGLGFALPKGSPYLEPISITMLRLQQTGIIEKTRRKFWPTETKCSQIKYKKPGSQAVSITDAQGAYYIVLLGFLCGYACFILEILHKFHCKTFRATSDGNTEKADRKLDDAIKYFQYVVELVFYDRARLKTHDSKLTGITP